MNRDRMLLNMVKKFDETLALHYSTGNTYNTSIQRYISKVNEAGIIYFFYFIKFNFRVD